MKGIVVIGIITLLLVGGGFAAYYLIELNGTSGLTEVDYLNIAAREGFSNIITNYTVATGAIGNIYTTGDTQKGGFVRVAVPANDTIFVYNSNKEDQFYYTDVETIDTSTPGPHRVLLDVVKPSDISVSFSNIKEDSFTLRIGTSTIIKNVHACVYWTTHVVTAKFNNSYSEVIVPNGLGHKAVRCYDLDKDIEKGKPLTEEIIFTSFGIIDDTDYISVTIYDTDPIEGILTIKEAKTNINNI